MRMRILKKILRKKCMNPDCDEYIYLHQCPTEHNFNIKKYHDYDCRNMFRLKLQAEITKETKLSRRRKMYKLLREKGLDPRKYVRMKE